MTRLKRLMSLLLMLSCLSFLAYPVKVKIQTKSTPKDPWNSDNNYAPFNPPVLVTYDPDTREIEITGDDSWMREAMIFDDWGQWYTSFGNLPATFTVPSYRTGMMIVKFEGYEWDASAVIYL